MKNWERKCVRNTTDEVKILSQRRKEGVVQELKILLAP
jgi:hypothetical protein